MTSDAWALRTSASLDDVNLHLAALDAAGLLGITEEGGVATVYLTHRSDDLPLAGTWERVADRDWNEAWKADLEPVRVGDVTVIAPWHAMPDTGITVVIEPAQAFGTGHHETTTGCLAALQTLPLQGRSVFDVGTGTGVLAIAAHRLGASRVVAADTDPLAVEAAVANAAGNAAQLEVFEGSADAVGDRFDVVVANLDTATLSAVAADLARRMAADGTLIASGVSNERVAEAQSALAAAGIATSATTGREWAVLRGRLENP